MYALRETAIAKVHACLPCADPKQCCMGRILDLHWYKGQGVNFFCLNLRNYDVKSIIVNVVKAG